MTTAVPPSSLLNLTFDCLAHIASFVDSHTLVNVLPTVCKALRDVAYDPVVWAMILVEPCSETELLWLAGRFPSIRYVEFPTRSAELVTAVAAACPGILQWDSVVSAVRDHDLQLATVHVQQGNLPLPPACHSSLKRIDCMSRIGDDDMAHLVASCPNVTQFVGERVIERYSGAFPRLVTLTDYGSVLNTEAWESFVSNHGNLRQLSIMGIEGSANATTVPTRLTSLLVTSSNPEIINLGYEVLRANAGTLARVSWESCGEEFLSIAAEMTALQELVILEELAVDVSMETLGIFADAARLRKCEYSGSNTLGAEVASLLARALGPIEEVPMWAVAAVEPLNYINSFDAVRELSVDDSFTAEACEIIGPRLKRLRSLSVVDSVPKRVYEVFVPVASQLRALRIRSHYSGTTDNVCDLVAAALASPNLQVISCSSLRRSRTLLPILIEGVSGRTLEEITFLGIKCKDAHLLRGAVHAGALRAFRCSFSFLFKHTDRFSDDSCSLANAVRVCGKCERVPLLVE